MWLARALAATVLLGVLGHAAAQTGRKVAAAEAVEEERESPWLVVPILSIDPKLGTSLGAMAGYMHHFDEKSRLSMLAVNAQWTSTGSVIGGVFGTGSWAEDQHRLVAAVMGGQIKNDYDDYLGSGVPLRSDSDLSMVVARYLYRLKHDWFVGGQFLNANFSMTGQDPFDQQVLDVLGMKGFTSGGIGLVVYHDSREIETSPTRGWVLNMNNMAFRPEVRRRRGIRRLPRGLQDYWSHGAGHVLAVRQYNQWTVDAPPESLALGAACAGTSRASISASTCPPSRSRNATAGQSDGPARSFSASPASTAPTRRLRWLPAPSPTSARASSTSSSARKESCSIWSTPPGKDGNYGVYMKMGYSF